MTTDGVDVIGGVDTHGHTYHAAVSSEVNGTLLGDKEFPATAIGYRQLLLWLLSFGRVVKVGPTVLPRNRDRWARHRCETVGQDSDGLGEASSYEVTSVTPVTSQRHPDNGRRIHSKKASGVDRTTSQTPLG